MKACSTCSSRRNGFYGDRRTRDGLKSQCRKCHTEGSIRTRDPDNARRINREHMRRARIKDPEKFRARDRARVPRGRK